MQDGIQAVAIFAVQHKKVLLKTANAAGTLRVKCSFLGVAYRKTFLLKSQSFHFSCI